ncbi:MAG: DUF4185 domain-containing protein [Rhizomicrobium sp.]|jgi:hypothetical protein
MSRTIALWVAGIAAVLLTSPQSSALTISLVAPSTKVCQLTGDADWATNLPTAARTWTRYRLDAVDLGFPVDSGEGPLYFLFGDAWPIKHPAGSIPSVPPDDAVGWTTRTAPPDPGTCLDLRLATSVPHQFAHPIVIPPITQGLFNVPSGGVFVDDSLFAFFWTDHCAVPGVLMPDPTDPLHIPPPNGTCAEVQQVNSVGRNVLARASLQDPILYRQSLPPIPFVNPLARMPSGFVYVSAAKRPSATLPILDFHSGDIPVIGVPRYRASIPYLALAPRDTFGDPATWSFFAGRSGGNPVWIDRKQWESGRNPNGDWAPPPNAELYDALPAGERCMGEHSLTWNEPLKTWLLVYNCRVGVVEARIARDPWGPWSPPVTLLSPAHDPGVVCTLIMSPNGCSGLVRRNYWPVQPSGDAVPGGFYAAFVLNRFTQDVTPSGSGPTREATVYWLVSTWNPYAVVVMESTLAAAP